MPKFKDLILNSGEKYRCRKCHGIFDSKNVVLTNLQSTKDLSLGSDMIHVDYSDNLITSRTIKAGTKIRGLTCPLCSHVHFFGLIVYNNEE